MLVFVVIARKDYRATLAFSSGGRSHRLVTADEAEPRDTLLKSGEEYVECWLGILVCTGGGRVVLLTSGFELLLLLATFDCLEFGRASAFSGGICCVDTRDDPRFFSIFALELLPSGSHAKRM